MVYLCLHPNTGGGAASCSVDPSPRAKGQP